MESISNNALYPLSFEVSSPTAGSSEYLADPSVALVIDFFQKKGLAAIKQEDRDEAWYQDWIEYQARHGLYAALLSPQKYSNRGNRFNLRKLVRLLEVLAYFSPAHGYSLHVSLLGLLPILMGSNEALKREAIEKLEQGGLFAFAVSEKAHGSDLFANEFMVKPAGQGSWHAEGNKYYIGNANAASLITILAKESAADSAAPAKRSPFVFFVLRPSESPAYRNVRKIRTLGIRTAFVGEFEVTGHAFPDSDVISRGRAAWDAIFDTVNLGKFFLGFGAVGICEHAFAEAIAHLGKRVLYKKLVTQMPHIRAATAFAFARLTAMKLFAFRALEYLQASNADERRYLLFNAVQKARVSTEGVKVLGLLSECVGARGFESETYFESALRDAALIPVLEGSTHINFGLTAQFIDAYFLNHQPAAAAPMSLVLDEVESEENPYWLANHDRTARTVRFAPFLQAYEPLRSLANVRVFRKQAKAFRRIVELGDAALNPAKDAALLIGMGKCLSIIAYAQLVAENCLAVKVPPAIISVIFHGLVEDLSAEALKLSALVAPVGIPRLLLNRIVRIPKPVLSDLEFLSEWIAARYPT